MTEIIRQRMTHQHTGELVVFLIGMRINQWWRSASGGRCSGPCRRCSPSSTPIRIPVSWATD